MSIKLPDDRYEKLKEIACNTLFTLDIHALPISGFELLTKLNAKIFPYSSKSLEVRIEMMKISQEGFSVYKECKWYVFYNDTQQYERINYTLLHEAGHIILDHTQASEVAESEANFIAKYIIAPPVLIHALRLKSPKEIKETFKVSEEESEYAYSYYEKWLMYGDTSYKNYEIQLLKLFSNLYM